MRQRQYQREKFDRKTGESNSWEQRGKVCVLFISTRWELSHRFCQKKVIAQKKEEKERKIWQFELGSIHVLTIKNEEEYCCELCKHKQGETANKTEWTRRKTALFDTVKLRFTVSEKETIATRIKFFQFNLAELFSKHTPEVFFLFRLLALLQTRKRGKKSSSSHGATQPFVSQNVIRNYITFIGLIITRSWSVCCEVDLISEASPSSEASSIFGCVWRQTSPVARNKKSKR